MICSSPLQSPSLKPSNSLPNPVPSSFQWRQIPKHVMRISMRDRSNNRKPLQRGRDLSIEAIQTVQALKRAKSDAHSLDKVFDSKFSRLLKFDMVSVLRELIRQGEFQLGLQAFEDIRKEHWYKPRVLLYNTVISALVSAQMLEEAEFVFSTLKNESKLEADAEGFSTLMRTLVDSNMSGIAMECLKLMIAIKCDPDKPTFKMLIHYLESKGEMELAYVAREEALKIFWSLEFLEEEDVAVA